MYRHVHKCKNDKIKLKNKTTENPKYSLVLIILGGRYLSVYSKMCSIISVYLKPV
jgi:hypothetical protein